MDRIRWIARDALSRFPGRIIAVTMVNLFGIATAMGTIGGVLGYAHMMEQGESSLAIGPMTFALADRTTFVLFASGLAVLGVISASCIFFSEWSIARLAASYESTLVSRVLHIVANRDAAGWQLLADDEPRKAVAQLMGMKARLTAIALRNLLQVILPLGTFVVATGALIWSDIFLAGLLLPVAVVFLGPLYLINRGVAQQQRAYADVSKRSRSALRGTLRSLVQDDLPADARADRVLRALDDPMHEETLLLFWWRKLAVLRVQFINTVFFVVCLIGLFLYFGLETSSGDRTWSTFLTFIIAVRFALGGLRQSTARFVKLSRFLPDYADVTRFIEQGEANIRQRQARHHTDATMPDALTIRCGGERRFESAARRKVMRGELLWILTDWPISRVCIEGALARIESQAEEDVDLAGVGCVFASALPEAASLGTGDEVIALDAEMVSRDVADQFRVFLREIDDRYVLLVTNDPLLPTLPRFRKAEGRVEHFMVLEGGRIVAHGDRGWFEAHTEALASSMAARREASDGFAGGDAEADEDDDDEF